MHTYVKGILLSHNCRESQVSPFPDLLKLSQCPAISHAHSPLWPVHDSCRLGYANDASLTRLRGDPGASALAVQGEHMTPSLIEAWNLMSCLTPIPALIINDCVARNSEDPRLPL